MTPIDTATQLSLDATSRAVNQRIWSARPFAAATAVHTNKPSIEHDAEASNVSIITLRIAAPKVGFFLTCVNKNAS
ncbi:MULTISPECIES: hypothetical protein [Xanthomonas]|uniref:hypothetical protein n=1 Tax=Xanthomonas TaxID=338 RepID=UPI000F8F567A|nr:hypothetical protein [Xanthomonas arboricola]NIK53526.1 hypothetical protein [Xanthomonas arboricola]CAD2246650.1 hypothetical protein X12_002169 [Xanthomonas arboricola]